MRSTVLAPAFQPLVDFPWVRLALMATIPCGTEQMVHIRRRLGEALLGYPLRPRSREPPVVLHAEYSPADLPPDYVFVGFPKNEQ